MLFVKRVYVFVCISKGVIYYNQNPFLITLFNMMHLSYSMEFSWDYSEVSLPVFKPNGIIPQ